MKTREELQAHLEELLGSRNVYFQPATNTKINYPCIVYRLEEYEDKYADNKRYISFKKYTITHIYHKYSSNLHEQFRNSFMFLNGPKPAVADGLYHDVYTLYY